MNEDLALTRRGLLQMVGAIVATASFAARRPLFGSIAEDDAPLDAELIEDEPFITDHAGGARLEQFLRSRGIKPAHLARESGYSRQFLLLLRFGRVEATSRCIAHIVRACQRFVREPIHASDLFELSAPGLRAVEQMQRAASSTNWEKERARHARVVLSRCLTRLQTRL
jgi:hypothetical protein